MKPQLSVNQILAWADAYFERVGKWPGQGSGRIPGSLGEKWGAIDKALKDGYRGLPGKSSLAQLLSERRGVRNGARLPSFTTKQILAWADRHHHRTGEWPTKRSGSVLEAPGETWWAVQSALVLGGRGLPGGSTLTRLLAEQRGVPNRLDRPPLAEDQILAWADAHFQRSGKWPTAKSGPIPETPGATWQELERALRDGYRGLAGGSSLARLLNARRPIRDRSLSIKRILCWADEFHQRHGHWPNQDSGPVDAPEAGTWRSIAIALNQGLRGLPGGMTLARLLARKRGKRNHLQLPRLNLEQILDWADRHHRRSGKWPGQSSGAIRGVPGQTWSGVQTALRMGLRGLPGSSSLAQVLAEHRGARNQKRLARLTIPRILRWARAHQRRTGRWPSQQSGPIPEAPGETWSGVGTALRRASRGLGCQSSLRKLFEKTKGNK